MSETPTDEQIRAYLDRNPDAFRRFLHEESRRDPRWLVDFVRHQERTRVPLRMTEVVGRAGW